MQFPYRAHTSPQVPVQSGRGLKNAILRIPASTVPTSVDRLSSRMLEVVDWIADFMPESVRSLSTNTMPSGKR